MRLSVAIPVYRAERYIERCARSLFEQTYGDIEFVFVDDAGGDGSLEVVRRLLDEYPLRRPHVRFVSNGRNLGQDGSRMRAVREATGELMTFCDADDWVDTDLYELMVGRLVATRADIVFAPMVRNENDVPPIGAWREELDLTAEGYLDRAGAMVAFNSLVNKIFRRSLLLSDDLEVPANVRVGEDMCRTVQLVAKCTRIVSILGSAYHYRENSESATRQFDARAVVAGLMAVYEVLDRKLPADVARKLRKLELTRLLFLGLRFDVLSADMFASYEKRLRAFDSVRLEIGTTVRQRVLLKIAQVCFPMARVLACCLRGWKFKGF